MGVVNMLKTMTLELDPDLLKQARFSNEPHWLKALRENAWKQINSLEMPILPKSIIMPGHYLIL